MYKAIVSLLERYYVAWHLRGRPEEEEAAAEAAALRDEARRRMESLMRNDVCARGLLLGLLEQLEKANAEGDHPRRNRAIVSIHNLVIVGNEYKLSDKAKREIQAAWYKATTRQEWPLPRPPAAPVQQQHQQQCTPSPPPSPPPMALAFSPPSPHPNPDVDAREHAQAQEDLWLDFYEASNENEESKSLERSLHHFVMGQLTQRQRTALRHVMYASS